MQTSPILRNSFCRAAFAMALGIGLAAEMPQPSAGAQSSFAAFDREMTQHLAKTGIPGGALAVAKDGKLCYTQAYGLADRERGTPVKSDALFRIASLSKPITAVAVLKLVEEGRLRLDARAFDLLPLKPYPPGKAPDPRLATITVEQLLRHTAGWDRDRTFDPISRHPMMAKALGVPSPIGPTDMIRYMLGQPLDFDPGSRHVYSNLTYIILGRIIERVSGMGYEAYVKQKVLAPLGITRMRIGETLRTAPDEVRYHTPTPELVPSIFDRAPGRVPPPYGGFYLEAMDAYGGWLTSASDLARFAAALDRPEQSHILKPETIQLMFSPPPPPVARAADGKLEPTWYGLGWQVRPVGPDRVNTWHTGLLPGTWTLMVRRSDGWSWVALFNQSGRDGKPYGEIDAALHRAANATR